MGSDTKGCSQANPIPMRGFAQARLNVAIIQQAVRRLPCDHKLVWLLKLKNRAQQLVCAQRAAEHGWSRAVLTIHIEPPASER
jgi:predicted nuclease of restriction endonuclease-like (RecB) superfamily